VAQDTTCAPIIDILQCLAPASGCNSLVAFNKSLTDLIRPGILSNAQPMALLIKKFIDPRFSLMILPVIEIGVFFITQLKERCPSHQKLSDSPFFQILCADSGCFLKRIPTAWLQGCRQYPTRILSRSCIRRFPDEPGFQLFFKAFPRKLIARIGIRAAARLPKIT